MNAGWQFWIDRGGTFTDVVALDPDGRMHVHKLLSDNPEHYADAPLAAIHHMLGLGPEAPIPVGRIAGIRMGTTLATNALLERKGARVGLAVTRGHADLLEIGYQNRPDIFALEIVKPEMLAYRVVEIDERLMADGTVRTPLDEGQAREALEGLRGEGIEALAVVLLHAYAYPEHERRLGALARKLGFSHVSLSHETAREIKAVGRGDTTVADAYLTPLLRGYVDRLRAALGDGVPLRFMQSSGGLADAARFSGKDAILSGPAGGVVACAHVSRQAGFPKAIGFDMGGTSTDVSRVDERPEYVYETTLAGVRIKAPMVHIVTVAAGGGSILQFQDGRFVVGPESAGAVPGPACYRRGGPAAVTDANLVLGRIQPRYFPACFGPGADKPLDPAAARDRLAAIGAEAEAATGRAMAIEEVAAGFVRIANENMAKPIKEISVAAGYDVQDYALCCFGGAGAQHACAIADALGMRHVLLHPFAGVLSAYGMGLADITHDETEAVLERLSPATVAALDARFAAMAQRGGTVAAAEGIAPDRIAQHRFIECRYEGVDAALVIEAGDAAEVHERFEAAHGQLYGFTKPDHPIEIVNIRLQTVGATEKHAWPGPGEAPPGAQPEAIDHVTVHFDCVDAQGARRLEAVDTPVYRRDDFAGGMGIAGPALIVEAVSTVVVDPGWHAAMDAHGTLILSAAEGAPREQVSTARDPVMLEVFNNLFMSIATQMGHTLERVSHSTNIKERLDFSCAVFTGDGELVANAPHIPVHLGAMSESVRAIVEARGDAMAPGDVFMTNDPYHGGSHLPDITVVTPVFDASGRRTFFVASRGHHADIGGTTPGSMPPFSSTLEEEGVVLHNVQLVTGGRFEEAAVTALLSAGPYPARNLPERLSDLRAQIAANTTGVRLLNELCARYGIGPVLAYMAHVRANAAETMRARIAALPDGVHRFEDPLDDGTPLVCTVTIAGDRATVDFGGTGPQLDGNLNAPPAVVIAAVLYVFRTLVGRPIPLNGGCLDPIAIDIPEGSLLRPRYPAAVAGGNVETSQRVVDVLYGALGVLAAGQGTMNNLSFGTGTYGYYETICGGAGAGPKFHGASAVHVHMTNTRITDPEVLERRYPVLLRRFAVRRGSGGRGTFHGGDGVVREIEFLAPMHVTMLSERRITRPFGVNGAEPGAPGRNAIVRGGLREDLPGRVSLDAQPGDIFIVETPGGGGFGPG